MWNARRFWSCFVEIGISNYAKWKWFALGDVFFNMPQRYFGQMLTRQVEAVKGGLPECGINSATVMGLMVSCLLASKVESLKAGCASSQSQLNSLVHQIHQK